MRIARRGRVAQLVGELAEVRVAGERDAAEATPRVRRIEQIGEHGGLVGERLDAESQLAAHLAHERVEQRRVVGLIGERPRAIGLHAEPLEQPVVARLVVRIDRYEIVGQALDGERLVHCVVHVLVGLDDASDGQQDNGKQGRHEQLDERADGRAHLQLEILPQEELKLTQCARHLASRLLCLRRHLT